MGKRGPTTLLCALLACAALAAPAQAAGNDASYALVHGCYALKSAAAGKLVAKTANGYAASADTNGAAEAFRMQATTLGQYLLYGKAKDFLGTSGDQVVTASDGGPSSNWAVDVAPGGGFTLTLVGSDKALSVGDGGALTLVPKDQAGRFTFESSSGCADFPEITTNATGTPYQAPQSFDEVRGTVDAHIHGMAFEFLGGMAHCGKPWDAFGVTHALVDCPDHYPNGAGAVLENTVSYGNPVGTHDPVGWPTFKDWPNHASLTHEQTYYKWLERAWRGGLRVWVNLFVENKVLCELYPLKKNSCDEMDAVRLQNKDIHALQDYIDAQSGGPGKGFFRIVTDPFQARQVINSGKLAVVLGIEVSEPFGCRIYNGTPQCTEADITKGLDEVYGYGVRDMEIINKFDNALAGVAGDNGTTGAVVNQGNKAETGRYWDMETCTGPADEADKEQPTPFGGHNDDQIIANGLQALLPAGATPLYPAGPHCNRMGLTQLGEFAIRGLMARRMIVDPDHLSVRARQQVMSILEAAHYSGVVSSHSWSTPDVVPRIYNLGGFITPYAGDSTTFVKAWKEIKPQRNPSFYWGFGYGADMNGFGHQGGPRPDAAKNPVTYPFKALDPNVTMDKQVSGQRVFDINKDGVAHYGLYPDWIEDLRKIAGDQIVKDMSRGAEAYLEMWERTEGVAQTRCQPARTRFTSKGLGRVPLGATWQALLRSAGQPSSRPARVWRYCLQERDGRPAGRINPVLTPGGKVALILTTGPEHKALGAGRHDSVRRLPKSARSLGRNLRVAPAGHKGARYVYGVAGGRVRFVALASKSVAAKPSRLRAYLKLAGY